MRRRPPRGARGGQREPEDIGAINRTDEDFDRLADGRPANRDDPALHLFGSLVEDVRHGSGAEPSCRDGGPARTHRGRHALAAGAGALAASLLCVTGAATVTGLNPVTEVADGMHELVGTPHPLGTRDRPAVHGGGGPAPAGPVEPTGSRGPDDRWPPDIRTSSGGSGTPVSSPGRHGGMPGPAATRTGSGARPSAPSTPDAPSTDRTTVRSPPSGTSPGTPVPGPEAPTVAGTPSATGTTPERRSPPTTYPTPGTGTGHGPQTGPCRTARPRTGGATAAPECATARPGDTGSAAPRLQPNGG